MNPNDRFERDLSDWFAETVAPRMPDYVDDILWQTARSTQRARWTFPERWIPERLIAAVRATAKPVPWRAIGVLVILALLAAAAIYVGSQPRLPAPFGQAANGLVAYEQAGDIYTVDPLTGARRPIVTGPDFDHDPRFSLDGTRLVFLRRTSGGERLVIADAHRGDLIIANEVFRNPDSDSIAWSPDGRMIAIAADLAGKRGLNIVDTTNGQATALAIDYVELEVYWRPPDGRELMFLGGAEKRSLYLVSVDGADGKELPLADGDRQSLRPSGWTPDGRRFAYHQAPGGVAGIQTYVVDVATGAMTIVPIGFGQLSNDGTRIAGYNADANAGRAWICVARIGSGPCVSVGEGAGMPAEDTRAALQWSPDDRWLIAHPESGAPVLVDPELGTWQKPLWGVDGADSWQRVAP